MKFASCVYTPLKILCQDFVFDHDFLRLYEYHQNGHEKPNKGHERELDDFKDKSNRLYWFVKIYCNTFSGSAQ
jgi:hypothetical protein